MEVVNMEEWALDHIEMDDLNPKEQLKLAETYVRTDISNIRLQLDMAYQAFKDETIGPMRALEIYKKLKESFEEFVSDQQYYETIKREIEGGRK